MIVQVPLVEREKGDLAAQGVSRPPLLKGSGCPQMISLGLCAFALRFWLRDFENAIRL